MNSKDEDIHKILNYEDLDNFDKRLKFHDPFFKKRDKPLTERLIKEGIINEEFIMMLDQFSVEDLIILKFESIYSHFNINSKFNVLMYINKIQNTILRYKTQFFEESQVERIFVRRKYKKIWKKFSDKNKK
jgi:hypothetical protein